MCAIGSIKVGAAAKARRRRYLQVELLVPDGVQLLRHGAGPLLHLTDLDSDVRIGRAALVFRNKALSADD